MNISSTSCSRLELRSSRKANKCKPLNEVSKWRNESVVRNGASVNDGVKSLSESGTQKNNLEVSKNFNRYRSENNFVRISKIIM